MTSGEGAVGGRGAGRRWARTRARAQTRRGARCRREERGATTLVETVLIAPALLLLLMLVVQFGLMLHARNVAEQAAQEGASVARRFDGDEPRARARTEEYLRSVGGSALVDQGVVVRRTGEQATVTVTGHVMSLVPGLHLSISESATGPVERYVPPVDPR